jgi:hypothetical protein
MAEIEGPAISFSYKMADIIIIEIKEQH